MTQHRTIKLWWIININVKVKTTMLSHKNIQEYFHNLGLAKILKIYNKRILKLLKTEKLDLLKLRTIR